MLQVNIFRILYLSIAFITVIDEGEFGRSWLSDPKVIEKLMERPGYQDYIRQGFGDPSDGTARGKSTEQFRVSTINSNFSVSKR